MENFKGIQYYPNEKASYTSRIQAIINHYYENDTSFGNVGAETPADEVAMLSNHLTTFPKCVNEYVAKELVNELSQGLPQDDIDDLNRKHEKQCADALEAARAAIIAIERYAGMTSSPHLFTQSETEDLSDGHVLELIIHVITDMYDEEYIPPAEYISELKEERQTLDTVLLSLDYDD